MERNRRLATWIGLILGALSALLLNSALAHASGTNKAVLMEELHRTCPLAANARIALEHKVHS